VVAGVVADLQGNRVAAPEEVDPVAEVPAVAFHRAEEVVAVGVYNIRSC